MNTSKSTPACSVCEVHAESVFKIDGMDCREEVAILERRLKPLPGLEALVADVLHQRLHVTYDAARVSTSAIVDAVADTGMRAWLEHEEPVDPPSSAIFRQLLLVVSGACLAVGLAGEWLGAQPLAVILIYAVGIAAGGSYTARRAWSAARVLALDINVLMMIAAAGAIGIGQWSEAAAVVFLFALAQVLEARSLERARRAIGALMELTPTDAIVRQGAREDRVPVDRVGIGDVIVIRPGDKIPLDGEVVAGSSYVNQAPITGESLPSEKQPGAEVFAGTINGRGALDVRVTRLRRDTTLARIIHLVESAQAQRAPAQRFVDSFARYYTPAVIVLAASTMVLPPLLFGLPFGVWFYRGLVLLVVSCPCALVISTPVSVVSALAGAARKGVLIKGGIHLERTGRVRCVAFDKTGTLTNGSPEVVDILPVNGASPRSVLRLAAALESRSEHPIGRAIVRQAIRDGIDYAAGCCCYQALPGRGAEGHVDGRDVVVGSHRLFEERRLCSSAIDARLEALAASGSTTVLVARDGQTLGIITVDDRIRESGRDAIDLLRRQGIERMVMLTGDSARTARAIALELGVDDWRAELLPEDKVAAIDELRRTYGSIAMVGDGINDAPALAAADVGIVMGAAGSDAALETADVALMADELLKIPYAVRLSRSTLRNIKVNIALSLTLKAAFVAMAIAGIATLWMAVLADTGASLLVIANGLRLLRAD